MKLQPFDAGLTYLESALNWINKIIFGEPEEISVLATIENSFIYLWQTFVFVITFLLGAVITALELMSENKYNILPAPLDQAQSHSWLRNDIFNDWMFLMATSGITITSMVFTTIWCKRRKSKIDLEGSDLEEKKLDDITLTDESETEVLDYKDSNGDFTKEEKESFQNGRRWIDKEDLRIIDTGPEIEDDDPINIEIEGTGDHQQNDDGEPNFGPEGDRIESN